MSRQKATIKSRFWMGGTGETIVCECTREALALCFYLMTNPHAHMSGIYFIRLETIALDLHSAQEVICSALNELINVGFCKYDHDHRVVWVVNMARDQSQFMVNSNHHNGVVNHLQMLPATNLIDDFMKYYHIDSLSRTNVIKGGHQ